MFKYCILFYGFSLSFHTANSYIFPAIIKGEILTDYTLPSQSIIPKSDDENHHECYRQCTEGSPKTCYYHFHIEWYTSLSKACFDCPFNKTDCDTEDCVVANGRKRTVMVINRQMPGPSIQVCHNDRVIVDLKNSLMSSGTTIHWHGMHQKSSPYMDGTPYVTQCPILPESTFRYDFVASEIGTHFYHSHIGLQRADGAFGSLIVRRPRSLDPHSSLYDYDISDHVLIINDWTYRTAMGTFLDHYHSSGANTPESLLINGVGKFSVTDGNRTVDTNPAVFEVMKGYRHRFRLINAEFLTCPVELSIEGHNITVISTDGSDIQPINVSALVSFAGERFDFILNADQDVGNYWIQVRGLLVCSDLPGARQVAVLRYIGAQNDEPNHDPDWNAPIKGPILNPSNTGEEQDMALTISRTKSILDYDARLKPKPDYKLFINYDLNSKNNTVFHRKHYEFNEVKEIYRMYSPQFNHITMETPKTPLLVSRPPSSTFCNSSTTNNTCIENFCQCPHVISLKLNSIVELILIDEGRDFSANHPFHLHGHSFRVLSQYRIGERTTREEVKELDRLGLLRRNLENAPVKDTVAVPDGGYAVVRFQADNPGYWLFHCHIEFHSEVGMALVFKVGEHEDMLPVPEDFPSCGDFLSDDTV